MVTDRHNEWGILDIPRVMGMLIFDCRKTGKR
jgi:hypothetical protein